MGACAACTHGFGELEINLRDLLAICLVPHGSLAQKAITVARQNFNPRLANTEADRGARASRQRQLLATAQPLFEPPTKGAVPFSLGNLKAGHAIAIPIDGDKLIEIVRKWTRGVHFKLKEFIEADFEIRVLHLHGEEEEQFVRVVSGVMELLDVNPSVGVLHAIIPDEKGERRLHLYGFNLWDQYRVYGWILDPRAVEELKQS